MPGTVVVKLAGSLSGAAGGPTEFEVPAGTINQILERLLRQQPVLEPVLEDGVAVAVNGVVYQGDFSREVAAGAEVMLLSRIIGG